MDYTIMYAENDHMIVTFNKTGNKFTIIEYLKKNKVIVRKETFEKFVYAETWFKARCIANQLVIKCVDHELDFANID